MRRKQAAQTKQAAAPKPSAPASVASNSPVRRVPPRALAAVVVLAVAVVVAFVATILTHRGASVSSTTAPCVSRVLQMEPGTRGEQYSKAPSMQINSSCAYTATIATSKGPITVALDAKTSPVAVNNFVFLATHHFYTNILFHRVIKGFMIQTGDPTGTGTGGPGYTWPIGTPGTSFPPGTVAMANNGTNGSQFFICQGSECAGLSEGSPGYTVFGHVTSGMSVVNAIASVPVKANSSGEDSSPVTPVYMQSVSITEDA